MIKGLIVSCQVEDEEPQVEQALVSYFVHCAIVGGADGLRVCGVDNVRAVREMTNLPIIGLTKFVPRSDVPYITILPDDVHRLADAGADYVAVDATPRNHWIYEESHNGFSVPLIGDIDTMESAEKAADLGRFCCLTTALCGYTDESIGEDLPAKSLALQAQSRFRIPVILEGGIWTVDDLLMGVPAICVGSAITRPHLITKRFKEAICASVSQPS